MSPIPARGWQRKTDMCALERGGERGLYVIEISHAREIRRGRSWLIEPVEERGGQWVGRNYFPLTVGLRCSVEL